MTTMNPPQQLRASASAPETGDRGPAERAAMRQLLNTAERIGAVLDITSLAVRATEVRGVVAGQRRVLVIATCKVT